MERKMKNKFISRRKFLSNSILVAAGLSVSAHTAGNRVFKKSYNKDFPVRLGVDVSGHALSEKTFAAVKTRVDKGATCIIAKRLYDQHASGKPTGNWLVVKSFLDPGVAQTLKPFLGPPNIARFRFANHIVEFEKGSRPDQIEVKVVERV